MKSLVGLASVVLLMLLGGGNASAEDGYVENFPGHFALHLRYFDNDKNAFVEVALPNPSIPVNFPPAIQTLLAASLKNGFDTDWNITKDKDGKTHLDKACDQIIDQTGKNINAATGQNAHDINCHLQPAGELRAKIQGNHLFLSYLLRNNSVDFKTTTPCIVPDPFSSGCAVGLPESADPKFIISFDSDLVVDIVIPPDISVPDTSGKIVVNSAIVHTRNANLNSGNLTGDLVKDVNSVITFVGGTGIFPPAERRINNITQDQTAEMQAKFAALTSGLNEAVKFGFTKLNATIDAGSGTVVFRLTHPSPQVPAIEQEPTTGGQVFVDPPAIALVPTQAHPADQLTVTGQKFDRPKATQIAVFIIGGIGVGRITDSELEWGPQNGALRRDKVARKPYDAGGLFTANNLTPNQSYRFHARNCELIICSQWSPWVTRSTLAGSDKVELYVDAATAPNALGQPALKSDGTFSGAVKLPAGIKAGSHQVLAVDGNQKASANFTVVAGGQKFSPHIRFVDAQGQKPALFDGNTYTLHGEGFAPGQVHITFDSQPKILANGNANNTGMFQVGVPIPTGTSGNHVVHAKEQAGGTAVEATLTEFFQLTPR